MQRLARDSHRGHRAPFPRAVGVVELAPLVVLVVELRIPALDAALEHQQTYALVHGAVQVAHVPQRQHGELAEDVEAHVAQVLVLEQLNPTLLRHERLIRVIDARRLRRLLRRVDGFSNRRRHTVRVSHRGPDRVPLS